MPSGHTVVAFDNELTTLHRKIAEMGGLAEEQLMRAMEALVSRDENLASSIIGRDAEIDRGEAEVEALAVRVLALRQPMAKDLRQVITALKVSTNLERIGDHATNVAETVCFLVKGRLPGEERLKEDLSSFTVVNPPDARE